MVTHAQSESGSSTRSLWLLYAVFLVSGMPALIYQLCWQRALFTLYGVNIESITIVVAAFLLGLGLGSLGGGYVSKRPVPVLLLYGIIELAIAAFGVVSMALFHWVGEATLGASVLQTGALAFCLVLFPTFLMGATLPLLAAYLVDLSGNVGRSVGMLYFVNTLGSSIACFGVALLTMRLFGLQGTVNLAAGLNVVVGGTAVAAHYTLRRRVVEPTETRELEGAVAPAKAEATIPLRWSVLLSALTGFIAVSYEIVWARVFSLATHGTAMSFPFLLGAYLFGIAFGSLGSRHFCTQLDGQQRGRVLRVLAAFALSANIAGFLVVPGIGALVVEVDHHYALILIAGASAALGAMFPLISHLGVPPDHDAGAGVSFIYLANIIGSAGGSLITGFVLLDVWSLASVATFLATLGIGCGVVVLAIVDTRARRLAMVLSAGVGAVVCLVLASGPFHANIYEKLQFRDEYAQKRNVLPFKHVVETRSGLVTVDKSDVIYGGGVYDGKFGWDLVHDSNMIVRAYAMGLFHPDPKRVFMVGLSSGSWAQVIANHPSVEKLTIVEINPGYLEVIPLYPEVRSLLSNPKVEIIIDDGRRFLSRSHERYDVVYMNTTYHWRSHSSNLLSLEFFELVAEHMAPGAVFAVNTTSAPEVYRTAGTAFPHARRFYNFAFVSNEPLQIDLDRWASILESFRIDGRPVLDMSDPEHVECLANTLASAGGPGAVRRVQPGRPAPPNMLRLYGLPRRAMNDDDVRVITDDNMGTEWMEIR